MIEAESFFRWARNQLHLRTGAEIEFIDNENLEYLASQLDIGSSELRNYINIQVDNIHRIGAEVVAAQLEAQAAELQIPVEAEPLEEVIVEEELLLVS